MFSLTVSGHKSLKYSCSFPVQILVHVIQHCMNCTLQWAAESTPAVVPAAVQPGYTGAKDWSATDTGDWAATSATAASTEWGGGAAENWG